MKNKFIIKAYLLCLIATIISCTNTDDFTGESSLIASSPSLTVNLSFDNDQTLVETNQDFPFTVTISEPQIANISVKLTHIGGTASRGDDFDFPNSVVIPKGQTSATGVLSIFEDDLVEDTENATIQIALGNESNVSGVSSETVTFNIQNLTGGDLAIGLSWSNSSLTTDNGGNEIDPYDLADLRLLLTDVPYTTILDEADGAGAESYVLTEASPDGEYYIVADFYDAMDDIPADIDLNLSFDQIGTMNGLNFDFAAAMNTGNSCSDAHLILVKIIKTGGSYTIEEVGAPSEFDINNLVGTWSGQGSWYEHFSYGSEIVTTLDANGDLWMTGIAFQWMEGWWGEVITDSAPVKVDVDLSTGEFVIVEQYHITTTYGGDPQPVYNVSATGTFGGLCAIQLDMSPVFHQGGDPFNGSDFGGVDFREYATLD